VVYYERAIALRSYLSSESITDIIDSISIMKCLQCDGDDLTEIWLLSSGRANQVHTVSQLSHAKVPLSLDEAAVLSAEWQEPSPVIRTFCCISCGFIMQFAVLNDKIEAMLNEVSGFDEHNLSQSS